MPKTQILIAVLIAASVGAAVAQVPRPELPGEFGEVARTGEFGEVVQALGGETF